MTIIPAILEQDYNEIESKIDSVYGDADIVHIDICDGLLTKQKTWPYSQCANNRIDENIQVKNLLNENNGLPHWEYINYEFDLMIQNPDLHNDIWGRLGANTLILHTKSFRDKDKIKDFIADMNGYMIDIVLAFTYDEYFEDENLINDLVNSSTIKSLQVMTIKNVGFQGQSFDDRCIELVQNLKDKFPHINIRVDGGINENTIDNVLDYADDVVIGSAIFGEGNARENLNYFKYLC